VSTCFLSCQVSAQQVLNIHWMWTCLNEFAGQSKCQQCR
jgi:hypothetical protein